jgi:8-amino-7-oxononanoate synthase
VLLFPSGYQVNVGVLSSLLGRNDLAICDEGIHASLIDGCRLGQATIRRFDRGRLETLDKVLVRSESGRYAASVLVADAIYSMDGDILPLDQVLARVPDSADPLVLVDEAHSLGILGDHGQGLAASTPGGDRVDLVTGNLSKSLASMGGYVAGSSELISALTYLSRSFLFSTAGNPAALGAALAALQVMRKEPERRPHAMALADRLRAGLHELGLDTGRSQALIVPVIVGDEMNAVLLTDALARRGICAGCAVAPAVPSGRAIVRFSISASLSETDIDRTIEVLGDLLGTLSIEPRRTATETVGTSQEPGRSDVK